MLPPHAQRLDALLTDAPDTHTAWEVWRVFPLMDGSHRHSTHMCIELFRVFSFSGFGLLRIDETLAALPGIRPVTPTRQHQMVCLGHRNKVTMPAHRNEVTHRSSRSHRFILLTKTTVQHKLVCMRQQRGALSHTVWHLPLEQKSPVP